MGNKETTKSNLINTFGKCEGNWLLIKIKYVITCATWGEGDKCKDEWS